MKERILGKTGRSVSEIGLGTWQLGTRWGDPFNRQEALKILETAEENGIRKTALICVGRFLGDSYSLSRLYDRTFETEFRRAKP